MWKNDNFLLFFYYVKYSSVIISQKGLYQIFSNLSFSNKWTGWWWNQLKLLLEQTFSPVASSGHPCDRSTDSHTQQKRQKIQEDKKERQRDKIYRQNRKDRQYRQKYTQKRQLTENLRICASLNITIKTKWTISFN